MLIVVEYNLLHSDLPSVSECVYKDTIPINYLFLKTE